MPRLPGAQDVERAGLRAPGLIEAPRLDGAGSALQDIGGAIGEAAAMWERKQLERQAAEDSLGIATAATELSRASSSLFLDAQQNVDGDARGFTDGLLKQYRERADAIRQRYGNLSDEAQARIALLTNDAAMRLEADARVFEHNARSQYLVASTNDTLSALAVDAFRQPTELPRLMREGAMLLDIARESGAIDPAGRIEMGASFATSIGTSAVNGLIAQDPAAALARLQSGEFDTLIGDPDLLASLQVDAQRAIDRIEAERLAALRPQVNDALFILERGKTPPGLDGLIAATAGTEYAEPLQAAINARASVDEFVHMPVADQQAQLAAMRSQEVMDREGVERLTAFERAHAGVVEAVNAGNGLVLAAELGVVSPLAQFDPNDAAMLRQRAAQAEVASRHFGIAIAPLTPEETAAVEAAIDAAPADSVAGLLRGLETGLGPDGAQAVAAGVVDDRPELGMAIVVAPDRPLLAREIVLGGRLLRQNPDLMPTKENRLATAETVLGDLFTPETAGALDPIMDAAAALYAARIAGSGSLTFDADLYEQALRDVTGGPVRFNSRTIIPPLPDMASGEIRDALAEMTYDDLTRYGNAAPQFVDGTPFDPARFDAGWFGTDAQLISAGPGRYLVLIPGLGYIATPDGKAYELNLRAYMERRP